MSEENAITIRLGSLEIATPEDVIRRATTISKELVKVVEDRKLYSTISGRKYVRVEGWETLGAMLGIMPREVDGSVKRFEDGSYEATVELIRVTDGAVIGRGSAFVGMDEPTWGKRLEYARRSMAITRATGKAYRLCLSWIMALAGYEPTPAEEMDGAIIEAQIVETAPNPTAQPINNKMSLESAMAVTNRDGKLYGDLETSQLAIMHTALSKKLKDNGLAPEEREEKQYKRDAIEVILAARAK